MKKFLSLVLALVMTMSLVTISAGAKDFTDNSKITYKEAVDVISAVKVVDGYTDGSFNPSATLTRGAAAKIICNLILGPTTAGALKADAAPYKDVPADSTFAGYIAYCAKEGIISGYADGTFKPGNTLTGYAFMKMLLGALGYDKSVEGYEGANWSINVAKRALNIGLDKGLTADFNGTKPVTREEAALYAFNTLTATMVEYKNAGTITVGDITIKNNAVASEVLDNTKDYSTIVTNDETTLQFCEKYFKDLKLTDNKDDLYRSAREWTWKNKVVGTYATEDADLVYTKTVKAADMADNLKDYTFAATCNLYVNGFANGTVANSDAVAALTGDGRVVELYLNGTVITKVVVINTYIAKVSSVDTKAEKNVYSIYKGGAVAANIKAEIGYGDFEKNDYAVVTPIFSAATTIDGTKAPAEVIAAEKVVGVPSWVKSDNKQVTIDGTTYKLAANASTDTAAYTFGSSMVSNKKSVDLFLDANGYVLFGSDSTSIDDYIMVIKAWEADDTYGTSTLYVQGVLADGTVVTYPIKGTDTTSAAWVHYQTTAGTAGTVTKGDTNYICADNVSYKPANLLKYTMDGKYIQLAAVNEDFADPINTTSAIKANDKYVGTTTTGESTYKFYYSDDVKFVLANKSGADAKAAVADSAQKIAASALAWVIHDDDTKGGTNFTASTVFVYGTTSTSSYKDTLYINSGSVTGTNADGSEFKAYINGEEKTITIDTASAQTSNKFYTYNLDEKGRYELTALTDVTDNVHGLATLTGVYANKNLVSFSTPSLTDYDASEAQIVDLTDNGITTLSGLKSLLANCVSAAVKCGIVYDTVAETIDYIYIVSADVAPTNSGTTVTYTGVDGSVVSKVEYKINSGDVVTLTSVTDGTNSFTFTATGLTSGDKLKVTVTTIDGYIYTGTLSSAS